MEDNLDAPASPAIAKVLELPADATWRDCLERVEQLKKVNAHRGEHSEQQLHATVDAGIAPDRDGYSKLWPSERDFALNLGREYGIDVLRAFIARRNKITPAARYLREKTATMKNGAGTYEIDKVQREINAQVGLREETFRRYYPIKNR